LFPAAKVKKSDHIRGDLMSHKVSLMYQQWTLHHDLSETTKIVFQKNAFTFHKAAGNPVQTGVARVKPVPERSTFLSHRRHTL
jgi:hypothetical protein